MRISIRTAAFSLVLSVMLWLYITLQAEYEVTMPIQLEVHLPSDRSLASPLPAEVYVKLRGTGWNLLNALYLDRSTRIALQLPRDQRTGTLTQAELRAAFRSPVPLRVAEIEPSDLRYQLDIIAQKKVRLEPNLRLDVADGYVLARPLVIVPDSVVVIGSQSVVDTISRWRTVPLERTNLHRSILELVDVEPSPIVRILPEKVIVKGVVQQLAELTYYDVPVNIEARMPADAAVLPSRLKVTVRGGLEDIERILDRAEPPLTLRLTQNQLRSGGELFEPIVDAPAWVHSVALQPRFLVYRRVVPSSDSGFAIRSDASP